MACFGWKVCGFPADTPFHKGRGQISAEQGTFHLYLFLLSPLRPPHVKLHIWAAGGFQRETYLAHCQEEVIQQESVNWHQSPGIGKHCGKLGFNRFVLLEEKRNLKENKNKQKNKQIKKNIWHCRRRKKYLYIFSNFLTHVLGVSSTRRLPCCIHKNDREQIPCFPRGQCYRNELDLSCRV